MLKKLLRLCLVLVALLSFLSLVGCSKTLEENQYYIRNIGNNFTITVNGLGWDDIKSVKVKIKYTYVDEDAIFSKTKTKTETFEVDNSMNSPGYFSGEFSTKYPVSEFECKKVVVNYGVSSSDDEYISIPMAIGIVIGCFIIGLVVWFLLPVSVEVSAGIAVIPFVISILGALVTGQWIPMIIFLVGCGAWVGLIRFIWEKLDR